MDRWAVVGVAVFVCLFMLLSIVAHASAQEGVQAASMLPPLMSAAGALVSAMAVSGAFALRRKK